jgi:hypothetical protein
MPIYDGPIYSAPIISIPGNALAAGTGHFALTGEQADLELKRGPIVFIMKLPCDQVRLLQRMCARKSA